MRQRRPSPARCFSRCSPRYDVEAGRSGAARVPLDAGQRERSAGFICACCYSCVSARCPDCDIGNRRATVASGASQHFARRDAAGRKAARKRAALALDARHFEPTAVALQRVLDDGETETRAARAFASARGRPDRNARSDAAGARPRSRCRCRGTRRSRRARRSTSARRYGRRRVCTWPRWSASSRRSSAARPPSPAASHPLSSVTNTGAVGSGRAMMSLRSSASIPATSTGTRSASLPEASSRDSSSRSWTMRPMRSDWRRISCTGPCHAGSSDESSASESR